MLSTGDFYDIKALYKLNSTANKSKTSSIALRFYKRGETAENIELLSKLVKEDIGDSKIIAQQTAIFGPLVTGTENRAVAYSLIVILEINTGFLADAKLWPWIEESMIS